MTNGNDIVEYEEKNHFNLLEKWADKNKIKVDDDFEENLMLDDGYWAFVEKCYFDDLAYYQETIREMSR
jgi:hypothetical protein